MRKPILALTLALLCSPPASADQSLALSATPSMTYAPAALEAKAGERITLRITNTSKIAHNFVLTLPGRLSSVRAAGAAAGAKRDYIPSGSDVLAHSALIEAGESETVSFEAPKEPGEYPFLCTVPAHGRMRGILTVR